MDITFYGGAGQVTGSMHVLKSGNDHISLSAQIAILDKRGVILETNRAGWSLPCASLSHGISKK